MWRCSRGASGRRSSSHAASSSGSGFSCSPAGGRLEHRAPLLLQLQAVLLRRPPLWPLAKPPPLLPACCAVQGRDVIAQAQSGTGKTSLIAITLCQMLDTTLRE